MRSLSRVTTARTVSGPGGNGAAFFRSRCRAELLHIIYGVTWQQDGEQVVDSVEFLTRCGRVRRGVDPCINLQGSMIEASRGASAEKARRADRGGSRRSVDRRRHRC